MTRRQWMWLWIWLLLFLIIFCVWNKLQTMKNAHHEATAPVTTVQKKQTNAPHAVQPDMVQQKDIMLKLIKENGALRLSGVFPSEEAVEKALKTLSAQGHKAEKGAIIIDPHANNPQLLAAIAQFGENLDKFDSGYIEYKEKTVTVNGIVDSNEAKEEIAAALAGTGKAYKIQNNLEVKNPPKAAAPVPVKEKAAEKNTTAQSPAKTAPSKEELKKVQAEKAKKEKEAELKKAQQALDTFLRHKRVEFVYAKDRLTPKSRKIIDQIVAILKKYPDVHVEIGGHTDSDGDAKRNLKLSQRRAEAVKRYLVKKGIAANRLVAKGYGESRPLVKNDTRAHKQINRRVEFKVIR